MAPYEPPTKRVSHRTVQDLKQQNADADPDELQTIIDHAEREVRAKQRGKGETRKPWCAWRSIPMSPATNPT